MRKTFSKIMTILMVVTMISIPTMPTFAAITEVTPNVHYDASDIFASIVSETDGFIMTSDQKNSYLSLGDNVFGVPVEQSDGSWLLPENSKKVNWSASETQTMTVNVTSAGDYSVYLLAREYNTRGFSITMSGIKADGTEYEDTYLTNYKNGENTPGISGQTKVGVSVTVSNVNLGVHFAKFKDLAVGKHNLSITYSGDAGKGVDSFFGLNVYQTKEYTGPVVLLEDVGMNNVTLLDEFLLNAESQDIKFLLELEPERFLYNWYRTSGLTPKTTEGYENSWERTKDKNFRGHMFGHYMSALAQSYIASDDESIKSQLLEKIKVCVNGVISCQDAYAQKYPSRAGYAAPFSEYWLNSLDKVDSGAEEWNQKEIDNSNTLVPWYNLHKVVAGLIDVYKYVDVDGVGEEALKSVQDFVDYVYNCRVSKYDATQKANMLKTEYGGMAEALYELYDITGKASYKECADGFIETALFKNLADNKDVLSGKHANTTIPKFIGALKKYTVLTQNENYYNELTKAEQDELLMYLTATQNFFDIVLEGHTFVTGGNSVEEHFRSADTISTYYNNSETHETCNEYNMLKLARELFKLTNDKKYSDYYEKTFINSILASQNPENGEMT